MRLFKIILLAVGSVCIANAQQNDPSATIITKDSEATGVLGGWPPKNFGNNSAGNDTVRNILRGTKAAPAVAPATKLTQNIQTQSAQQPSAVDPAAADQPEAPISSPLQLPALPKIEQGSVDSSLMSQPLVLPALPEPVDRVSPAIADRPPRPKRKRVKSLYTLGPGDSITLSTFERPDLSRTVRIAPDGTVSYLQAIAVQVKGLTVDELRDRIEAELQKYRTDFKLIVNPQGLRSKEFAVLGRVREPGTFPIERPTTVLEAIARAQGVEIGTIRGANFGLADFDRSFVSRGGRKLGVDFSKLYEQGDLSQNVTLQPNDYVYIASILKKEFYILGAVNSPGRVKITNDLTVTKAIALAGGFQNTAYKMKIVVIRGDLETPEVKVVNVRDVLSGKALDERIRSNDIVFIARRPFDIVERVLDSAITTYVQTLTSEAMNTNYTPFTL